VPFGAQKSSIADPDSNLDPDPHVFGRSGSADHDPDPHQNVMDPQFSTKVLLPFLLLLTSLLLLVFPTFLASLLLPVHLLSSSLLLLAFLLLLVFHFYRLSLVLLSALLLLWLFLLLTSSFLLWLESLLLLPLTSRLLQLFSNVSGVPAVVDVPDVPAVSWHTCCAVAVIPDVVNALV
jgi:hypothetical protein